MSGHHHNHDVEGLPVAAWLRNLVFAVAVATVVGLVVLWPRGDLPDQFAATRNGLVYVDAVVDSISTGDCFDAAEGLPTQCQLLDVSVVDTEPGEQSSVLIPATDFSAPTLAPGERVVLLYNALAPPAYQYTFVDYQRQTPILLLAIAFVLVVVGFGRWKGVRALAGLAVNCGAIFIFLLPALLRGHNAILVALVTTSVVAFAALYIAHGVNASTTVALVGTLGAVLLITVLAVVVAQAAHLAGLSDENFQVLRVTAEAIDPKGLLIAGIVIGALGVLDDVTVTQVAAVNELRHANPTMTRAEVYHAAIRIGRDHVASTVNTLVLAYAGASIALLLFFFQEGRSIGQVLNREIVAIEIVRALIGSIGLIVAVPATTALAAATSEVGSGGRHGRVNTVNPAHEPNPIPLSWSDFSPRDDA